MTTPNSLDILSSYRERVESIIKDNISLLGEKTKLRDACEYALTNGGKRFRPSLVLMLSKALGNKCDVSLAALSIELFHTASLVADDMPSMDDDDERRNTPSTHKVFGEAAALLVTYALISSGYECIAKNSQVINNSGVTFSARGDLICRLALENATFNTGLSGATGGQYLDIFPSDLSLPTIREVIHKKTVTLFEISFVFGWLFGGGDIDLLDKVKQAASHFGMAFQIADDLGDMEQDIKNGRQVNMANILGKEEATKLFHVELSGYREIINGLPLERQELLSLANTLEDTVR